MKVISIGTAVCAVIGISIYYLIQRVWTCWNKINFSPPHQPKTSPSTISQAGSYAAQEPATQSIPEPDRRTCKIKTDFSQVKLFKKFHKEVSKIDEPFADQESIAQSILTSNIWDDFRASFLNYISIIDNSRPLYDRIIESIFNWARLHPNPPFVRDILDSQATILKKTEMVYDNPIAALKAVSTLLKWLETRDTLTVQRELGRLIGVSTPPMETFLSIEDAIDKANNFSEWIKNYRSSLDQIEKLDLRRKQLISLPKAICQLSALQRLDLSHNRLTALPDSLDQLSALRRVDLSYNQLTILTGSMDQLSSLHWLNISDNQLKVLTDSIGQLSSLQWLSLSHNQLTKFVWSTQCFAGTSSP